MVKRLVQNDVILDASGRSHLDMFTEHKALEVDGENLPQNQ